MTKKQRGDEESLSKESKESSEQMIRDLKMGLVVPLQVGSQRGAGDLSEKIRDCFNQKHAHLEKELEDQKRHNQLLNETLTQEREMRKGAQDARSKDLTRVREALRLLARHRQDGLGPDELGAVERILDPSGLILANVLR